MNISLSAFAKQRPLNKVIAVALAVTTILWLTGIASALPILVSRAQAVTINDGDLIRASDDFKVWIVKKMGDKKFKRHLFGPQVLDAYGHLSFDIVKVVDPSVADEYTTSFLLKGDGDDKVYKLSDVDPGVSASKRWVETLEAFNANNFDWDGVYVVNSAEMALFSEGTNITGVEGDEDETQATEDSVSVSLASNTPDDGNVALGAFNKTMTKLKFTAGDSGYIVDSIAIKRNGLSQDNDVNNVKIWDGSTQLGSTQALNTDTHKANFTGLSWAVPANGSKTLTVTVSVNTSGNNGTSGNILSFGIASASDISTTTSVDFSGSTFPALGNEFTIAGISVGQLDVDKQTTPAAADIISGSTDQEVVKFKFTANSTEGFDVDKIVLTEVGTSVSTDLENIKLKILGEQIGSTVSALDSGEQATFTGSPLFSVKAGTNKDVSVFVDVAEGVTSQRTIIFEITEDSDVTAFGQNSDGSVQITQSSGAAYTAQTGNTMTVKQGTVTVTYHSTNPSAQTYVVGADQATIATFKFSAGSREGVKVTKFKLTEGGTGTNTDYQNVRLYLDDSDTSTGHTASIGTTTATFEDGDGLFEVPKSGNTKVEVKVDIPTGASSGNVLEWYLNAVTDLKMKGLDSNDFITQNSTNMTITSADTSAEATDHTLSAKGSLSASAAPDNPAATTFAAGVTGLEVLKFKLTASSEDMIVSSVTIDFWENDSSAETIESGDVTNAKLWDGSTLLDEVAGPGATATFNINSTVPEDASKSYTVTVDVPTTNDLSTDLRASLGKDSSGSDSGIGNDLTTTGGDSTASITETGSARGNLMTLGSPTVNVDALGTPVLHSVVTNTSGHTVGSISFEAGTSEDARVTQIKVSVDDATNLAGDGASANDNFSNIQLFHGSTQIGSTKQLSDGTPDTATFGGLDFQVTKGQSKQVDIKADVTGSTTGTTWYWGVKASNDLIGTGLSSGTDLTFNRGDGTTFTTQASAGVDIISAGELRMKVDADSPSGQNVAVGSTGKTGVTLAKFQFEARDEDVEIKSLKLTRSGGLNSDFAAIHLYDGGTKIIGDKTLESVNNTVTFNIREAFEAGDISSKLIVSKDTTKVVEVRVDYNGVSNGTDSADPPKLVISNTTDVTEEGVSSGSTSLTLTDNSPSVTSAGNYGALTLYKSVPTVSLASDTPTGSSSVNSAATVLKFDVAADSLGDVVFNQVAFTVDGTVDTTGSSNANLYKSSDMANALAMETYKTVDITTDSGSGQSTTVASHSTAGAFDGIPAGSNIRVYDDSGSAYFSSTVVVTKIEEGTDPPAKLTWDTALSAAVSTGDDVYYRPLQPGTGKLYFGGMTTLKENFASSSSISVTSANGFATGDSVKVKGFTTGTCTLVTTSKGTVKSVDAASTNNTLTLDSAIDTPAGAIIYDRDCSLSGGNSGAAFDEATGNAVIYTTQDARNIGTAADTNETISAGTFKTYVLKGDTTGATANESLTASIGAISDFLWDDGIRFFVSTLTAGLPMTGGTLSY